MRLRATDVNGCTNTTTLPIITSEKPDLSEILIDDNVCPGVLVTVTAVSASLGMSYEWTVEDGFVNGTDSMVTIKWNKGGLKKIKVKVYRGGCNKELETYANVYKTDKIVMIPEKEGIDQCVYIWEEYSYPFHLYTNHVKKVYFYEKTYNPEPINCQRYFLEDIGTFKEYPEIRDDFFARGGGGDVGQYCFHEGLNSGTIGVRETPYIFLPDTVQKWMYPYIPGSGPDAFFFTGLYLPSPYYYSNLFKTVFASINIKEFYFTGYDEHNCKVYSDTLKLNIYSIPSLTSVTSSITQASDLCFGKPLSYKAQINTFNSTHPLTFPGVTYNYTHNNRLVKSGRDSTWTLPAINSVVNNISLTTKNGPCTYTYQTDFTGVPLPEPAQVNCGKSGLDYISIKWPSLADVNYYEVSTDSGLNFTSLTGGNLATYTLSGLSFGQQVSMVVRTNFNTTTCGAYSISPIKTCVAIPCEDIDATISFSKSKYCFGDTLKAEAKNVVPSSSNFKYTWNKVVSTSDTHNITTADSLYEDSLTLGLQYLGHDPSCPVFEARAKADLSWPNEIRNIKTTVLRREFTLTTTSNVCGEQSAILEFDGLYANDYQIFTTQTNGNSGIIEPLQMIYESDYSTVFNIDYEKLAGNNTVLIRSTNEDNCSSSAIYKLPCTRLNLRTEGGLSCISDIPVSLHIKSDSFNYFKGYKDDSLLFSGTDTVVVLPSNIPYYLLKLRAINQTNGDSTDIRYLPIANRQRSRLSSPTDYAYIINRDSAITCGKLDASFEFFPKIPIRNYILEPQQSLSNTYIYNDKNIYFSYVNNENQIGPYEFKLKVYENDCPQAKDSVRISLPDKYFHVKYGTTPSLDSLICGENLKLYPRIYDKLRWKDAETASNAYRYNDTQNYSYYKYKWNTGDTTSFLSISDLTPNNSHLYTLTITRIADYCTRMDSVATVMAIANKLADKIQNQLCIDRDSLFIISNRLREYPNKMTHRWALQSWMSANQIYYDTLKLPGVVGNYEAVDTVCYIKYKTESYLNSSVPQSIPGAVDSTYSAAEYLPIKLVLSNTKSVVPYSVCVIKCGRIPIIPNVITPNDDGYNDKWVIREFNEKIAVKVFNRWGELVFEDREYANNWKGTSKNGANLPDGPYFYIITPDGGNSYATVNNGIVSYSCEPTFAYKELKGTLLIER